MIPRYQTPEMATLWSDEKKFSSWLRVELAVLKARVKLGQLTNKTYLLIAQQAKFDPERIAEIEEVTRHDLLAFVQTVQENLEPELRQYFHQHLTSFDTEEPATALLFLQALELVEAELISLCQVLWQKANDHKYLIKIQRTHGQHAEPITLGVELLWWYDSLSRQLEELKRAHKKMQFTKISGAVGVYGGGLTPQLEEAALTILGLKQTPIAAQIILRDRHAFVMNTLAVLAGVLEHLALNVRILGQTEICEIQEPFGKGQKGSSIMPHKKNTILSENLCGLARIVRNNAGAALENIPTWSGRDITQSSVERVIFPDSFNLVQFMLRRLKKMIEGLVIHADRMTTNLELTQGVIFSPDVKELLLQANLDPEEAYAIAQECAFQAIKQHQPYQTVLLEDQRWPDSISAKQLAAVFDYQKKVIHIDAIFERVRPPKKL